MSFSVSVSISSELCQKERCFLILIHFRHPTCALHYCRTSWCHQGAQTWNLLLLDLLENNQRVSQWVLSHQVVWTKEWDTHQNLLDQVVMSLWLRYSSNWTPMLRYACICVSKYSSVFTDKYSCYLLSFCDPCSIWNVLQHWLGKHSFVVCKGFLFAG